ncbi:ABC transporter ATP-binding protein [Oceanicola sp. 502str15]|uniref:ABC transporter ATP-binding protein n=1 Tax=Oceanicola sp. 502str15 TaxID=2696061 RepID=UPI00209474D0|nr:ABC transporter ATP-binding protein [Oceanicola sp. 502str15]MCO6385301.1 ATP-binding cassette domain-containing protein [Oceanicola sp. 502str15]
MLEVHELNAWYGDSHVLHGMTLNIAEGEVVTLLGRNGAGKTTTLKAIMGLVAKTSGQILHKGTDIRGVRPDRIARRGLGICPEHRGIFASLSVRENLLLPPRLAPGGMSLDHIYELFPNLKERETSRGTQLSGGEQQMLAIARILRTGVRFLLFDELTEGLAPVIVSQIATALHELKSLGYTILLVEQNAAFVSRIADRHYLVQDGRVTDCLPASEFGRNIEKVHATLGL